MLVQASAAKGPGWDGNKRRMRDSANAADQSMGGEDLRTRNAGN
jgi:hypothetical protein